MRPCAGTGHMLGFDRVYGVTRPASRLLFQKAPRANDLITIYEPLDEADCRLIGEVAGAAKCCVRLTPKVGKSFDSLAWAQHLVGCESLWIDTTRDCTFSWQDIESLPAGLHELLLPTVRDNRYSRIDFSRFDGLRRLSVSGKLKDLRFLAALRNLHQLGLWRVSLDSLDGIESLPLLEVLQIQHARIKDAGKIAQCATLKRLAVDDTRRISGLDLRDSSLVVTTDLSAEES